MWFNEVTHASGKRCGWRQKFQGQTTRHLHVETRVWLLQTRLKIPRPPRQSGRASKQIRSSRWSFMFETGYTRPSFHFRGGSRKRLVYYNQNLHSEWKLECIRIRSDHRSIQTCSTDLLGTTKITMDCTVLVWFRMESELIQFCYLVWFCSVYAYRSVSQCM